MFTLNMDGSGHKRGGAGGRWKGFGAESATDAYFVAVDAVDVGEVGVDDGAG